MLHSIGNAKLVKCDKCSLFHVFNQVRVSKIQESIGLFLFLLLLLLLFVFCLFFVLFLFFTLSLFEDLDTASVKSSFSVLFSCNSCC